ncbi:hypothetical protein CHCC20375_4109 [Bacillus licheniformis]|nr:hypothetical protein CHCC20375_4109 [Bacillus licheniformis]
MRNINKLKADWPSFQNDLTRLCHIFVYKRSAENIIAFNQRV